MLRLQDWLGARYMIANPVEEMCLLANVPARTLERRFAKATGLSPIAYVQALRVKQAKRRLERTASPVDEIAAQVGYENAAFFRRLFKRETRMMPGRIGAGPSLEAVGGAVVIRSQRALRLPFWLETKPILERCGRRVKGA